MLPKSNRLKKKKDIEKVFRGGKTAREGFIIFKFIENNLKKSRFCFVVSQKISKKAVLRNKIRRWMSEIVRRKIKELNKEIDAIFVALPGIENKNFGEVKRTVESLLKKI